MLTEYLANGKTYVCLKEILPLKPYAKGINSISRLITNKGYQDVIGGKIVDGKLVVLNGSINSRQTKFVNKIEILVLFESNSKEIIVHEQAPPILQADDLVFFKDDDGVDHHVLMRGQREKDKIFFKLKDVEEVFEINRLDETIQQTKSAYTEGTHYQWFKISYNDKHITYGKPSKENLDKSVKDSKELYFTYIGIKHLIEVARSGIAYKFRTWIEDVVFAVSFGTVEQKAVALARSFDTDTNHLKAVMNKTCNDISCIYLIDVKLVDGDRKPVYKYGLTKHLSRRMYEHKRKYGDTIELIQWSMVPERFLSEAETMIRTATKPHSFTDKDNEKELISLNNDELKAIISMYDIIGKRYLGCADEIKHYYEDKIKDIKHEANIQVIKAEHETELINQKMITLETKIESQASQIEFLQQMLIRNTIT